MTTRTGAFQIGFRAGVGSWQGDCRALAQWAAGEGFEFVQLGPATADEVRQVRAVGLDVLAVEVPDASSLLSPDPRRRQAAIDFNAARFRELATLDVRVFTAVLTPEDPRHSLRASFELATRSYGELAQAAEHLGTIVAIEGRPGQDSHRPNLCCNPEQCRAMLKAVAGEGLGLVYDPSHLIRLGIDHARFLEEFATRIVHVHAKDAEILTDNVYEIGRDQPSLTETPGAHGELVWRYTVPGHGEARWSYILRMLQLAGFKGGISIDLQDADFSGAEADEKTGLRASLAYLHTV